mmetsp:Transcript_22063/g.58343  ORF Transcript_22063/g.58343 Transcript_22063/m.58343 type:complete len:86 (+) Transcript_22063:270-527(+)
MDKTAEVPVKQIYSPGEGASGTSGLPLQTGRRVCNVPMWEKRWMRKHSSSSCCSTARADENGKPGPDKSGDFDVVTEFASYSLRG